MSASRPPRLDSGRGECQSRDRSGTEDDTASHEAPSALDEVVTVAPHLWQGRGFPDGSSESDWREAEEQFSQSLPPVQGSAQPRLTLSRIIVIEDNPWDVTLLQYIFECDPDCHPEFIVLCDGEEAIKYLLHPQTTKPDLVILDLSLPKRDGIEILRAIRTSEQLYGVRVVMFSLSSEALIKKKMEAAKLQIDGYVSKPISFIEISSLAQRFQRCYEFRGATRSIASSTEAV